MTTAEIITVIFLFALAVLGFFLSARHFAEKGFLLNNAWLYASEEERKTMDKKPHYRQSAIVFALLSTVFLVQGLSVLLRSQKLLLLEIPLIGGALLYAVVSSVLIEKRKQK